MNCLRLWRAEYTSVECPLGFRLSSPSSCYKFVRDRVTWHDAQRRCSSHNAHLLALETQTEQRLINNHLTHTRSTLTRNTPILEKLPRRLPPPPGGKPSRGSVTVRTPPRGSDMVRSTAIQPVRCCFWSSVLFVSVMQSKPKTSGQDQYWPQPSMPRL